MAHGRLTFLGQKREDRPKAEREELGRDFGFRTVRELEQLQTTDPCPMTQALHTLTFARFPEFPLQVRDTRGVDFS